MKTTFIKTIVLNLAVLFFCCSCTESTDDVIGMGENIPDMIPPISALTVERPDNSEQVTLNWKNPVNPYLSSVEITYYKTAEEDQKITILLDAVSGQTVTHNVTIEDPSSYMFTLVAINKAGVRSEAKSISYETLTGKAKWLDRANTLMTSMVNLYLNNKPLDIWSSQYPQGDGYWDGAAVIWGHGAAFSGYATLKHAAESDAELKTFIETNYDSRLLTGIDKFRNTRDGGPEAYAVYPGEGDERFYDDNIWVGIDMVDLYELTGDSKYLNRARLVWDFVLSGSDQAMGGGVYWKEGQKTKNTCSTAPAAVLGAKLYKATNEQQYLDKAIDYYDWVKTNLQDPEDHLYWDHAYFTDENDPNSDIQIAKQKYSYNSGQPIQAAALLYEITNEQKYLQDAQIVAEAAHARWFTPFKSYILNENFNILEPGHVWFQAITLRGFAELYEIDGNSKYIDDFKKTLDHAWLSDARNPNTNLVNENFKGTTTQNSWEVIHQGAIVEMLSRLAMLSE